MTKDPGTLKDDIVTTASNARPSVRHRHGWENVTDHHGGEVAHRHGRGELSEDQPLPGELVKKKPTGVAPKPTPPRKQPHARQK